jgi:uncharacterized damage-inducible protein DinB
MSTPAIPLAEFDIEMATTRRLLERVPDADGTWRPHPKSFPIAHLAQLIAGMPGWFVNTLRETSLDLQVQEGYSIQPTAVLLDRFDRLVPAARAALADVTGPALGEQWSLRAGDHVLFSSPRGEVVRNHLSHLVHHRGQLSVYLRLLDVPVPSIYGPTADEKWA